MIYNFNLGIGWASSGVEYAQIYRARMCRNIGVDAKFVFTDMFPQENIEHMTKNIGFEDSEVIWLYTFFTDFKTSPVSYTLSDLEKTFSDQDYTKKREGKICRYVFGGSNNFYTAYMVNDQDDYELSDLLTAVEEGQDIVVTNKTTNETITAHLSLSAREKVMIQYGGLLNAIKELGGDF